MRLYCCAQIWNEGYGWSVQSLSCPILCDPMDWNMPGFPVYHQLPEPTQTHVHRVSDTIQLSYPLLSPSSPAPNPSQHQGLFQWVQFFASGGQSIGVSASASVLPMNIQDWFPVGRTGWISLQSHGTVKSLLQHHSSKASILWHSAFFIMAIFKYVIKLKSEYPHTCPHYSIAQGSSYCTGIHSFIPLFIHLFILFWCTLKINSRQSVYVHMNTSACISLTNVHHMFMFLL